MGQLSRMCRMRSAGHRRFVPPLAPLPFLLPEDGDEQGLFLFFLRRPFPFAFRCHSFSSATTPAPLLSTSGKRLGKLSLLRSGLIPLFLLALVFLLLGSGPELVEARGGRRGGKGKGKSNLQFAQVAEFSLIQQPLTDNRVSLYSLLGLLSVKSLSLQIWT